MCDSTCELLKPLESRLESQGIVCAKRAAPSSCRICLSTIFEPAALTCGHRFCENCLNQYWHVRDKPDFIVCPLCRACAFNIDFAKKEEMASTEEFRKNFNAIQKADERESANASVFCLKLSIMLPAIYFMLKWLKSPIVELLTLMMFKLGRIL